MRLSEGRGGVQSLEDSELGAGDGAFGREDGRLGEEAGWGEFGIEGVSTSEKSSR